MMACQIASRGPAIRIAKGQEIENGAGSVVVSFDEYFVRPRSSEMVHVPWLGQTHDGLDQQCPIDPPYSQLRQFLMRTVYGVPSLKGHYIRVPQFL
jgi:hypothetical protein